MKRVESVEERYEQCYEMLSAQKNRGFRCLLGVERFLKIRIGRLQLYDLSSEQNERDHNI